MATGETYGTLRSSVQPEAFAGASIAAGQDGGLLLVLVSGRAQPITREVAGQLDGLGGVDWIPGCRDLALNGEHHASGRGRFGMIPDSGFALEETGILSVAPTFEDPPDERFPLAWTAATYAAATLLVPVLVFFAFAMLSKAGDISEALSLFGVAGWLLSLLAGLALGFAINFIVQRSGQ